MAMQNGTIPSPLFASQNAAATNPSIDPSAIPYAYDQESVEEGSDDQPQVVLPVDSRVVASQGGTRFLDQGHPAFPKPEKPDRHWVRWIVVSLLVVALIGATWHWGVPYVREALDTVSTDDAFVTGHVTNVGPRIEDVVTEVVVDRNDRVSPGDLLIKLDREPFEVSVAQSEAVVGEARAQLSQAHAQVRGQLAAARSSFFKKKNAQERLRELVATLRARVAELKARQSTEWLAKVDQKRIDNLVKEGSATQAELDQRNDTLRNAGEQVQVAWAEIQETRAALGLEPNQKDPLDLPKNLIEQQSSVQSAVSDITSAFAQLGIQINSKNATESKAFDDFLEAKSEKVPGEGLEALLERAPAIQVAKAGLEKAERDLDDAKLKLSYTEIRSEIAGYIQDRGVNPGDRVEPGQTLLSIRPDHVWIEANFKETQVRYLKIGMPVDLDVDAYPKRVFKGRVSGFSPGTGLSASLLPPENATGNYVKVTQRLPVRIELAEPNPTDTPLFAGLSVVPRVRFKEAPTGPSAGRRLHDLGNSTLPDIGGGPASRQDRRANAETRR